MITLHKDQTPIFRLVISSLRPWSTFLPLSIVLFLLFTLLSHILNNDHLQSLVWRNSRTIQVQFFNLVIPWPPDLCMFSEHLPVLTHPPYRYPDKFGRVLLYSPYLFGKKLFSMQDKPVNNKQTHFLKQNFSASITTINKRCEMLINLWINPVVSW